MSSREGAPRILPGVTPRVLLVGNGLLRLGGGGSWDALLRDIRRRDITDERLRDIPYAMQPEVLCGTDVEDVQRKAAAMVASVEPHDILRRLVSLPFDAILTSNYAYEIEEAISGRPWNDYQRRNARLLLHGRDSAWNNACLCNLVRAPDGRVVPVMHLHGELRRKYSMVLSYYSYANAVHRLIELNRERGNGYREHQMRGEPMAVWSWLDYFLLGEIYAIGFGFNLSEFDVWWAIERKAREKARHGALHAWCTLEANDPLRQQPLMDALQVEAHVVRVGEGGYPAAYERVAEEIEARMETRGGGFLPPQTPLDQRDIVPLESLPRSRGMGAGGCEE